MKMSFNFLFCVLCDKIISVRLGLGDLDSHPEFTSPSPRPQSSILSPKSKHSSKFLRVKAKFEKTIQV